MSLFSTLSTSRQIDILRNAQDSLIVEMAHILLRQGIDPLLFDETTYDPDDYPGDGDFIRLERVISGVAVTKERLAALG
jgi:hypothetical protein